MKKSIVIMVALLFALGTVSMSIAATAKKVADDQVPADTKAQKDQKAKQKPGQLKDKPGLHKEKAPGQLKDKPGQLKDKPGQTKLKDSKAGQHKDQAPATVR